MKRKKKTKQEKEVIFYLSHAGNDSWSGKLPEPNPKKTDGPFATLTKARDAIRKLKKEQGRLNKAVTVMLTGGTYSLLEPITFTPRDSGTKECPITYRAYPGEKVIISGGKKIIAKWKSYKGKIMVCYIPEVKKKSWKFRQLFVNGKRQVRARTPNQGFHYIKDLPKPGEKASFIFRKGDIKQWHNLHDVEAVVFYEWDNSRLFISGIDERTNTVTFQGPGTWSFDKFGKTRRYYVENILEGLDSPGEWYLDFETGNLYCWPEKDVDLEKSEIIAPLIDQLVHFKGNRHKKEYVRYISLADFTFSYTDYRIPAKGYAGGWGDEAIKPSAITLDGAEHCCIRNNHITNVGTYGIEFSGNSNHIIGNEISYAGSGGIMGLSSKGFGKNNTISDNHIHHCGQVFYSGIGISANSCSQTMISHNLIHHMPYCGIYGGPAHHNIFGKENIIEYNRIHDVMEELNDGGGIYCAGLGSIIRNNLIYNIYGTILRNRHLGRHGIYIEYFNEGIRVENNIVYGIISHALLLHSAINNIVTNNIFAFAKACQIRWTPCYKHPGAMKDYRPNKGPLNEFSGNIVYWEDSVFSTVLGAGREDLKKNPELIDYNIYYNASGDHSIKMCCPEDFKKMCINKTGKPDYWICNDSFDEWQRAGFDKHTIIADPLFVDPENGDFTLKANSPAFKMGFKPIDTSKIGLIHPADSMLIEHTLTSLL